MPKLPPAPLVWYRLGLPGTTLLCRSCAGPEKGDDARPSEFMYALSRAPRCDQCGWGPPEWLEARRRQRAEERQWRVHLNAQGRDAFGRSTGKP